MMTLNSQSISIAIVDDKPTIRNLLEEFFLQEGFTVYTGDDGKKAIDLVKQFNPSLLLIDLRMPDMNGVEALQEIKKIKPTQTVIMMTAYGEEDIVEQAIHSGAAGYISKPFDLYELSSKVEKVLKESCLEVACNK